MTDKQIIIDGCDVSGCEWIREIELDSEYICTCNSLNKTSGYCKYNPNCHYKLYKRKKQKLTHFKKENEILLQTIIKDQAEIVQKNIDETNILLMKENMDLQQQLKAKEQECEFSNLRIIQLQETLSQYETDLSTKDCIVETCKAQYKELEAENERLKKEIRLYACIDKWGTEQCHCACRCLGNEFCDAAEEKMKNIKKTLENIKEIAKKTLNMVDYKTYFKRDNKSLKQEGFKALNEILQKISEVEK